jgi:hypothetical protein
VRKARVLHDDHGISTMCAERSGVTRHVRGAKDDGVDLTALGVSDDARGGNRFEASAAQLTTTRFGECKNVRH